MYKRQLIIYFLIYFLQEILHLFRICFTFLKVLDLYHARAPSNPRDSFNTILNITKEKADDFTEIIDELEGMHVKNRNIGGPKKKLVWFLEQEDDIKSKCSEIIRQSQEELSIITTEDGLEIIFNSAHRLLDEIQENGVEIKPVSYTHLTLPTTPYV